jgi:predicted NBD/HSP70 family sugar kinase
MLRLGVDLGGTKAAVAVFDASGFEREVRLANDANCFALSEAVDGAARLWE